MMMVDLLYYTHLKMLLDNLYHTLGHDHGHYEDSPNGFYMMGQNHLLLYMGILYTCSIAFYNFFVRVGYFSLYYHVIGADGD